MDHAPDRLAMVLNTEWPEAQDPEDPKDLEAVQRHLAFNLDWFASPLYNGQYPSLLQERLGERLPSFTKEEQELLRGSNDFFALNCYSARYVCDDSFWRRLANTASTFKTLPYISNVFLAELSAALASPETAEAPKVPENSWTSDAAYEFHGFSGCFEARGPHFQRVSRRFCQISSSFPAGVVS